ncbi:hypothetical protein KAX35_02890, partial [candidate division WOR-3 bacterium]|nr:hypothetical protein [candidate division WOR-3 bacterium]
FAQDYKGKARVMDDDGYPHETIELWITVLPKYDLDISNNEWNLVSNILYLAEIPGNSDSGLFLLINPNTDMINVDPDSFGNADITNLTYTMTNLTGPGPDIITTNISITPTPMILASGYADTLLYEVDIPEGQIPGLYEGMAYVTSPGEDDTGDFFYVNLVVGPVESIVLTGTLDQTVDHGVTAIDTFMVTNNGNVDLDNIVFWVTDLYGGAGHMIVLENITFEPTSINELVATDSVEVKVHVNVPLGTYAITYTGMLRVIDDDGFPSDVIGVSVTVEPSYDLDICDNALSLFFNTMELSGIPGTSPTGNFLVINPNSEAMNADPDLFGNADLFDVDAVSTVLQHVDNPLYSIPTDSVVIAISQTLLSGSDEAVPVVVNIPDGQEEGAYVGTIIVWDMVVGVFDDFEILVQVASEEDIDIIETITSGSGDHASWVDLTTFTVENTGNTNLYNLLFNTSGLVSGDYFIPPDDIYLYVTDFWAPANEAVLDVLLIGESADVQPEVDVHRGQHAGIYSGFISVIDDDGYPTDAIVVSLEVFPSY